MTDFATWLQDYGYDRIFRMWKYKRMFTPFEQQEAFSDQSVFEESAAVLIKIRETADLPDGDVWIGYSRVETEVSENIEYCEQIDMVISNLGNNFLEAADNDTTNEHMDGSNMTNKYFLRTPNTDAEWSPDRVFSITANSSDGELPLDTHTIAYMSIGIRPAFYLNDDVEIKSGRGTSKEPYILSTNNVVATTAPIITTESQNKLEVSNGTPIKISVNDKTIEFDTQPFIDDNGRTQVPVRAVAELLNCKVDWQQDISTAIITKNNGDMVKITLGSDIMTVNNKQVKMDTTAIIKNDRTFIPVRFVAEAMGLTVEWEN